MLANAQRFDLPLNAHAGSSGVGGCDLKRSRNKTLIGYTLSNLTTLTGTGMDYCVTHDGSHFVCIANLSGGLSSLYSTDGISWQAGGSVPDYWQNYSKVVSNDLGVCIGSLQTAAVNSLVRTTDHGVTWTRCGNLPVSGNWGVEYGGGVWMAVSGSNAAVSFNDGVSWSAATSPGITVGDIAYVNGLWICIASYGTTIATSADNGTTWKTVDPGLGQGQISRVGDTACVGTTYAYATVFGYSRNGVNWMLFPPFPGGYTAKFFDIGGKAVFLDRVADMQSFSWKQINNYVHNVYGIKKVGNYYYTLSYNNMKRFSGLEPVYQTVTE